MWVRCTPLGAEKLGEAADYFRACLADGVDLAHTCIHMPVHMCMGMYRDTERDMYGHVRHIENRHGGVGCQHLIREAARVDLAELLLKEFLAQCLF